MTARFLTIAAALLLAVCISVPAHAATVALTLKDAQTQAPMANTAVKLHLSYGVVTGQTDQDGFVSFSSIEGRGFWLYVNGERQPHFYRVENSPFVVEVRSQGGVR
jgi:hypothetical protein